MVQRRLLDELTPMAQLNGIVHHLQLDLQLPETLVRLGLQRHGCFVASESYFSTDARVAHQMRQLADTLKENPWVQQLIPKSFWLAAAGATTLAAFGNSNLTALAVKTVASQIPSDKISRVVGQMPPQTIRIFETGSVLVAPKPRTLGELSWRLANGSENLRIESYRSDQGRVLIMYLPGTANWNPIGGSGAFDSRSDIELLSEGANSSSLRAAKGALEQFGVTGNDRIILVGYSQGGMVAAQLALSQPGVVGLVTMGAPIATQNFPESLSVISLEHSNDLVPAISGETNPIASNWATATRHVEINAGETVLKAHEINEYSKTSALADRTSDSGLLRLRQEILGNLAGCELDKVSEYRGTKESSWP